MPAFLTWFEDLLLAPTAFQRQLIATVVTAGVLFLLRWFALRVVSRRTDNSRTLYQWRKATIYATVVLATFLIGRVWFQGVTALSTYLGLLSAGLAIALQDPIVNLAGWLFILWRRPFEVGDRIQMGEYRGDVIDVRIFQFSIMEIGGWVDGDQATGRIIHVPNGKIFRESQANYTQAFPYIWNELPVMVTFESNWQKAKGILATVADEHALHLSKEAEERLKRAARRFLISYSGVKPVCYTSVADSGVVLTVRYMCDARSRRSSSQVLWEQILLEFGKHADIDFAYPTQRLYWNVWEGKPGARAGDADAPSALREPR